MCHGTCVSRQTLVVAPTFYFILDRVVCCTLCQELPDISAFHITKAMSCALSFAWALWILLQQVPCPLSLLCGTNVLFYVRKIQYYQTYLDFISRFWCPNLWWSPRSVSSIKIYLTLLKKGKFSLWIIGLLIIEPSLFHQSSVQNVLMNFLIKKTLSMDCDLSKTTGSRSRVNYESENNDFGMKGQTWIVPGKPRS